MGSSLPAIEVAYRGRAAMLHAIFGGAGHGNASPGAPSQLPQMTPKLFGALFNPSRGRRT